MDDLASLIPPINRARGYRLYDSAGRRRLDFWQNNGLVLLGHRPHLLVNTLKQVLEKGLLADLPSVYAKRLMHELRGLFPGYETFLFSSSQTQILSWASEYAGKPIQAGDIRDPLSGNKEERGDVFLWRAFYSGNVMGDVLLPILPVGISGSLFMLCAKARFIPATSLPRPISPLVLAGAVHSLKLLKNLRLPEWHSGDLLKDAPLFVQKDIYILPRCPEETYASVFKYFLKNGILISPYYPEPSIFPFELSDGELKKVIEVFKNTDKGALDA